MSIAGDGPFLFPSDLNPTGHQVELKTVWQKTLQRAKVPYFRIYDLRSTLCHSPQCGRRSRRVGDTVASPGGLSGLQTLCANETANEERSSRENYPPDQRNAFGFWHSDGSVKSIWHSFGTVGGACAVPIFSFESGDCSMCGRSAARAKWSSSATATMQRRWRSSIDPISVGVTSICRRRAWVRLLPDERLDS